MKFIIAAILLLCSAAAYAEDSIPALDDIPNNISEASKISFTEKKSILWKEIKKFQKDGDTFNMKSVELQTDEEFEALQRQQSYYSTAAKNFNQALANAPRVIPPSIFAMPGENEWCTGKIAMLNGQLSFLTAERDKLKKTESGIRQLVMENVTASRDLLHDTQSQSLTVLAALFSMADISGPQRDVIGVALGSVQLDLDQRAAFSTEDQRRSREKMLDASGQLKNLVLTTPGVLPSKEMEATKSATDAVIKIFKVIDRNSGSEPLDSHIQADFEDTADAVLDIAQAVNPVMGGAVKSTVGFPIMTAAVRALGFLEADRAEIERALEQNATALSYYDNRITKVTQDMDFYKERLAHQPSK